MTGVVFQVATDESGSAFGRRLRQLRDKAKLTQNELAEAAGIHIITISKLERGKIDPSWTTVLLLAEALEVSPNDFKEAGDGEPDAPEEAEPPAEPQPPRAMGKRK